MPEKARDCKSAFICAEAFQRLAEQFIPNISNIKESMLLKMSQEVGDLVACVTNLSFAIELYLKALLIHSKLPVPKTHDLSILYDKLPDNLKKLIEDTYDICWRKEWLGRRATITLAKGPPQIPPWDDNSKRSTSLSDLLKRSKDLFESWRYIFEYSKSVNQCHELHEFEYGLLRTAAEALRVELVLRLKDEEVAQGTCGNDKIK